MYPMEVRLWGEQQFKEHYSDVLKEPETLADKICDRLRPNFGSYCEQQKKPTIYTRSVIRAGGAFRALAPQCEIQARQKAKAGAPIGRKPQPFSVPGDSRCKSYAVRAVTSTARFRCNQARACGCAALPLPMKSSTALQMIGSLA